MTLNIFPSLTTGRPDHHGCDHGEGEPHMEERDAGDGVFGYVRPDVTRRPAARLQRAWRSYVCYRLWAGARNRVSHQCLCHPQQQEECSCQCQSSHMYVHMSWSKIHTYTNTHVQSLDTTAEKCYCTFCHCSYAILIIRVPSSTPIILIPIWQKNHILKEFFERMNE